MADREFIDFSFGGQSASQFNLYRVSDGNRYNDNLIPTLTESTTDVPGADGMYYFNTYYKQRQFTINFAYDNLSATDLRNVRNWLNGKEIKPLIFAEKPDRQYFAKVTGAPSFKYIPFDDMGHRSSNVIEVDGSEADGTGVVFKGEGSVQFTCYDPYAYSTTTTEQTHTAPSTYNPTTISVGGTAPTPFKVVSTDGLSANTTIQIQDNNNNVLYFVTLQEACSGNFEWNSATGMVKGTVDDISRPLKYIGNGMGNLEVNCIPRIVTTASQGTFNLSFYNRYI